jgi:uncharacterized protein (TIGR02001 family)
MSEERFHRGFRIEPVVMRTGSHPGKLGLLLASARASRQTRGGLRKALRETLSVTRRIRTLILICLAGCGVAHADGARVITGSIGVTSDFVYRGLSLTRGKPTAQASLDVEFANQFYLGGFIAGADPNPGPSPAVELDVWAGRYWRLANELSFDLRLSQYTYPDDPRRVNYNRSEITGTVGYRNKLYFAAIYSPNTEALGSSPGYDDEGIWAVEMSARHPLSNRFSVSAGLGHYALQGVYHDSYNYWNATLTAAFAPFEVQLAYLGIDDGVEEHFTSDSIGDRVAVTALWRFSSSR